MTKRFSHRSTSRHLAWALMILVAVSMLACRKEFKVCAKAQDCRQGQACIRGTCTAISEDAGLAVDANGFFDGEHPEPDALPDRPGAYQPVSVDSDAGRETSVDQPRVTEGDAGRDAGPDGPGTIDGDAGPDTGVDRPSAIENDAAFISSVCAETSGPAGLVAAIKLRAGKATGIALDGSNLFMSAHGLSLDKIPGAVNPCPEVASMGIDSSGLIEQLDLADRFDPISRGAACLADTSAQEVWALAADRGDVFAAGDYLGIVGYRVGDGSLRGTRPFASHRPPRPMPDASQGALPSDTCGWIPGRGSRDPAAVALSVTTPPGWSKRIGLVGYLYCNLFGIYDVSMSEAGTLPVLAYYRSAPPATTYVNSTIAAVWGEDPDRFYALSTVYAPDETWSYQFEVVQMTSPTSAPRRLGAVTVSRPSVGGVGSLVASGGYVYWAASEADPYTGGLRIFDVADAGHPALVGRLDVANTGTMPWKGASLAVSGSTVYFAGARGLQLIDVSDPRHPSPSRFYPWPESFGTCHGGYPTIVGDYAYVAVNCFPDSDGIEGEGTGGLAIYRVRLPRNMICDNQCVDLEQDRRHCGGCRQPCSPYQTCVRGACVSS